MPVEPAGCWHGHNTIITRGTLVRMRILSVAALTVGVTLGIAASGPHGVAVPRAQAQSASPSAVATQDAGWSFSPDGAQGQPMIISRQKDLEIIFYRSSTSGSLGMAVHVLHHRYKNPSGVRTAGVVIGKFELVLQIFSSGRKWDTAGGDMTPGAVADLMQQLQGVTTGNLVPLEHDAVPFSLVGAASALSQLGNFATAHALWMPPPLGPAATPANAAPPPDIEQLAHHPYDTLHGRPVSLPHFAIAQNCAHEHVEMEDSGNDCVGSEQKTEAALSASWRRYDSDLKTACIAMANDPERLEKYQALDMCLSRYQDDRTQWQIVSGSSGSDDIMPHDHPNAPAQAPATTAPAAAHP